MSRTRILIVDDHAVLRAGLKLLINAQPDLDVVAEASNAAAAIQQAQTVNFEVILLDITLPGQGGLKIIERLKQITRARILVLTMHDEESYLRAALAAGCAGYVVKCAADKDLLTAIRTVRAGRPFVLLSAQGGASLPALSDTPLSGRVKIIKDQELSSREREVLVLLVQGYTNQQCADRLFLSTKTVETYRARITRKLGLRSRADLIRYGIEMGLLSSPPESA
jgi:DNA-binding NarL/FixJ family response regulator